MKNNKGETYSWFTAISLLRIEFLKLFAIYVNKKNCSFQTTFLITILAPSDNMFCTQHNIILSTYCKADGGSENPEEGQAVIWWALSTPLQSFGWIRVTYWSAKSRWGNAPCPTVSTGPVHTQLFEVLFATLYNIFQICGLIIRYKESTLSKNHRTKCPANIYT